MELAQRGAYDGREHVRAFLLKVFGRGTEGPVANRLGNHMQLQPVIDVAADGKSAKIRIRMFQQMSFGPRASVGAAVYENTAVLEDGKWKLRDDHTYNTLAANYEGGWVRAANPWVPGPDKELPPDRALLPGGPGQQHHRQNRHQGEYREAALPAGYDDEGGEERAERAANLSSHLKDSLREPLPAARGIPGGSGGFRMKDGRANADERDRDEDERVARRIGETDQADE